MNIQYYEYRYFISLKRLVLLIYTLFDYYNLAHELFLSNIFLQKELKEVRELYKTCILNVKLEQEKKNTITITRKDNNKINTDKISISSLYLVKVKK